MPAVAVLSQAAMDGIDGSWAVLAEVTSQNSMKVAVDEDQVGTNGRDHTTEQLDYIVFSAAGPFTLTYTYERYPDGLQNAPAERKSPALQSAVKQGCLSVGGALRNGNDVLVFD
jgi:hypothetical protein